MYTVRIRSGHINYRMANAAELPSERTTFGLFVREIVGMIAKSTNVSVTDIEVILVESKSRESPPEIHIEANCFSRSPAENKELVAGLESVIRKFKGFSPAQIVKIYPWFVISPTSIIIAGSGEDRYPFR